MAAQVPSDNQLCIEYDGTSCPKQLEEANRTLTSDVANLANEKEELNNKLKEAMEGNSNVWNFTENVIGSKNSVGVDNYRFCASFAESEKSKDWEQQISQMKQSFEKQLQSERTLKTQVSPLSGQLPGHVLPSHSLTCTQNLKGG